MPAHAGLPVAALRRLALGHPEQAGGAREHQDQDHTE
jgi:hypothetical protein